MNTLDSIYGSIADAIREKEESSDPIQASQFSDRIRALESKVGATSYPLTVRSAVGATVTATQGDTVVTGTTGGGVRFYSCCQRRVSGL